MAGVIPRSRHSGNAGGAPNPDPSNLQDGEMIRYNQTSGAMEGSGDINTDVEVNFGSKVLRAATGAFDSGSIDMVGYVQSERGGYLQTLSKTTGRQFISLDYQVDNNGTESPTYDSRGSLITRQIKQPDDTQIINGLTSYSITPDISQDISQVYFNFVNPVDNFRARITSDITGEVISYIPSRSAFDKGEGLSLTAGEQTFSPETVLPELVGFPLTVEVFADLSIDVLGDTLGNPWRAVDVQDIVSLKMVDESDIALESVSTSLIYGGEVTSNGTTAVDISAGKGRIVSFDAQGSPTVQEVEWGALTNVAITNIATQSGTRFVIDVNGQPLQLPVEATTQTNRDYINISVVAHAAGIVGRITNTGYTQRELYAQTVDLHQTLGVTRRNGLLITPNTLLTIDKSSGEISAVGAGIESGNRGENITSVSADVQATFTTILGSTDTVVAAGQNNIDPGFYDIGSGVKEPVGLPASRATIQYIYQSILQPGGLFIQYGQTIYDTIDDAVLNASSDVVDVPPLIRGTANLIGRIAVRSDATDLNDPLQAEFLTGVKFGTGLEGGSFGGTGGGGDYFGPASSVTDEIHTYADTSGKSGKAASDISALAGVLQRVTPNADLNLNPNGSGSVVVGNSSFGAGDTLEYPIADGSLGDKLTTDGAGNLTFTPDGYRIFNSNTTLEYDDKLIYADSSLGDITLTLADNPRLGERKRIWVADNTNVITLTTANPSFPIQPPPQVGEGNIEGQWTLTSDFIDRYAPTSRDLTQQGTGGAFVPEVINGQTVDVYDFQNTSYLEAVASAYKGVLGSSTRSFTTWIGFNDLGIPTKDQYIVSWGDNAAGGGRWWYLRMSSAQQAFEIQIKNAVARFDYTALDAAGLFDGNMHRLSVVFTNQNVGSAVLQIDGVPIARRDLDNSPGMNTIPNFNFKLGSGLTGNGPLDGRLYDARLFDRALSQNELDAIFAEDLSGGVNLSAADNNMAFDVTYNGAEWILGVGTEALALTNEAGLSALEQRVTEVENAVGTKVEFEMSRTSSLTVGVGFDQTINYSTVFKYLIDDQLTTPVMTNGVWTVDVGGTYLFSLEGWLDRIDIGYDTDYVIFAISRNGQGFTTTNPAATANLLLSTARHFGSINLSTPLAVNAGDTVEVWTRNIGSTSSWELKNFIWKATLLNS